jgi:hypothetical protein
MDGCARDESKCPKRMYSLITRLCSLSQDGEPMDGGARDESGLG